MGHKLKDIDREWWLVAHSREKRIEEEKEGRGGQKKSCAKPPDWQET
jgi:hypothetical protein